MEVEVNYLAVVLAMLGSMAVGAGWYAQAVFGKSWMKLAKVDPKAGNPAKAMAITVVVSLITAYVLAHVAYISQSFFDVSFMESALNTAFWLWLGLTAARFVTHDAFEGRPMKLTAINLGNEFVTLMVMGLIIGAMGV